MVEDVAQKEHHGTMRIACRPKSRNIASSGTGFFRTHSKNKASHRIKCTASGSGSNVAAHSSVSYIFRLLFNTHCSGRQRAQRGFVEKRGRSSVLVFGFALLRREPTWGRRVASMQHTMPNLLLISAGFARKSTFPQRVLAFQCQ